MKRTSIVILFFVASLFIVNLFFSRLCSAQQDHSEEVNKYILLLKLSKSSKDRKSAARAIERSGLSDPTLFNIIKARLLDIDRSRLLDSEYVQELSWYCKALASSGKIEYKEILENVALTCDHEQLEKTAKQSIVALEKKAKRNAIMASDLSGQSPTFYINMLKSGDDEFIKDAAMKIFRASSLDPAVYEAANEVLLDGYKKDLNNKDHIDTLSWLCKVLGASGNPVYKETLEKVINYSWPLKLTNHATKSLEMLNK